MGYPSYRGSTRLFGHVIEDQLACLGNVREQLPLVFFYRGSTPLSVKKMTRIQEKVSCWGPTGHFFWGGGQFPRKRGNWPPPNTKINGENTPSRSRKRTLPNLQRVRNQGLTRYIKELNRTGPDPGSWIRTSFRTPERSLITGPTWGGFGGT